MTSLKTFTTVAAAMLIVACSTMPNVTRSGKIQDVLIKDEISPTQLTAKTGDEIRWINRRQGPVKIIFLQPVEDRMSCSQGFDGLMGTNNETTLNPNESASICFSKPGSVKYRVRGESNLPTGEVNMPGSIRIEERTG